jgi:eukaryotic-like serine/threonine-protein kinase
LRATGSASGCRVWPIQAPPFRFIKFLDQCAGLILLKKVGGGYIFIHRMLLEYFAELRPSRTEKRN